MTKKTLIAFVLALSLICSFSLVSVDANEDLAEFLEEGVTSVTITITPDSSLTEISLDTRNADLDSQSVSLQDVTIGSTTFDSIAFSFKISELLATIDGKFHIGRGFYSGELDDWTASNAGSVSGIGISTFTMSMNMGTKDFLQAILDQSGVDADLSSEESLNTFLGNNPLAAVAEEDVTFIKTGTNYKISVDEGFGENPADWKANIENEIREGIRYASVQEIIDNFMPFLSEPLDTAFLDGLGLNYSVESVDLSGVLLEDGSYTVPVNLTDGSTTYSKSVTLVLKEMVNKDLNILANGNYVPTNPQVSRYILGINNLSVTTINVSLFDVFSSTLPSNLRVPLKYMEIEVMDNPENGGEVLFKVPASDVSNPVLVSLYVLDSPVWTQLPTTYLGRNGEFHEYRAVAPHFSMFLIGEQEGSASGGGSSSRSRTPETQLEEISTDNTDTTPISAGPANPESTGGFFAGITGAFIGALSGTSGVFVVVFIVAIVGLVVLLRTTDKLNRKSDKNAK